MRVRYSPLVVVYILRWKRTGLSGYFVTRQHDNLRIDLPHYTSSERCTSDLRVVVTAAFAQLKNHGNIHSGGQLYIPEHFSKIQGDKNEAILLYRDVVFVCEKLRFCAASRSKNERHQVLLPDCLLSGLRVKQIR